MATKPGVVPELLALKLPHIEDVVVIGGATMELYRLRTAEDIDMVVSLKNWRYLRDELGWQVRKKPDGRRFLTDSTGRFDVWRWWFNPQNRTRISLDELITHSHQHDSGFYYPAPSYLALLKAQLDRPKDREDIQQLRNMKK